MSRLLSARRLKTETWSLFTPLALWPMGNSSPCDLDFGVLLSNALDRKERFEKSIDLLGVFNSTLKTDEVDLVILNDGPLRFAYNIIKTGNLLFCRDRSQLTDFIEKTIKYFLDFRPARDRFDREFLRGIGYHG